nr:hypothetical protein [Quadrisphaera granulorum]
MVRANTSWLGIAPGGGDVLAALALAALAARTTDTTDTTAAEVVLGFWGDPSFGDQRGADGGATHRGVASDRDPPVLAGQHRARRHHHDQDEGVAHPSGVTRVDQGGCGSGQGGHRDAVGASQRCCQGFQLGFAERGQGVVHSGEVLGAAFELHQQRRVRRGRGFGAGVGDQRSQRLRQYIDGVIDGVIDTVGSVPGRVLEMVVGDVVDGADRCGVVDHRGSRGRCHAGPGSLGGTGLDTHILTPGSGPFCERHPRSSNAQVTHRIRDYAVTLPRWPVSAFPSSHVLPALSALPADVLPTLEEVSAADAHLLVAELAADALKIDGRSRQGLRPRCVTDPGSGDLGRHGRSEVVRRHR